MQAGGPGGAGLRGARVGALLVTTGCSSYLLLPLLPSGVDSVPGPISGRISGMDSSLYLGSPAVWTLRGMVGGTRGAGAQQFQPGAIGGGGQQKAVIALGLRS